MSEELETYEVEALPFRVDNDEQAAWAMRRFAAACKKIEEHEAILARERLRWQAWLDEVNKKPAADAQYFHDLLTDYLRRNRDERKSIKLPHGVIKSRATQPKYEIQPGFVEWAREHRPELLRVEHKPDMAAVKAAQDLEYVEVLEGGVNYSVEIL